MRDPALASARLLKARLLFATADYEQALALLQALSEEYPEAPEPYNNLAVIYAAQQQIDKAQQQLAKALQTHAGYQTAYNNFTVIFDYLANYSPGINASGKDYQAWSENARVA